MMTLPPAQATSMPSLPAASTVPGWPAPSAVLTLNTFRNRPLSQVKAPGQGVTPRTRFLISTRVLAPVDSPVSFFSIGA